MLVVFFYCQQCSSLGTVLEMNCRIRRAACLQMMSVTKFVQINCNSNGKKIMMKSVSLREKLF